MKYIVTLNGKDYEVEVTDSTASIVEPGAKAAAAKPAEPKPEPAQKPKEQPASKPAAAPSAGGTAINAPMPGTVLKILVSAGDTVSKDQVVAILEAMKMENEIYAPCDGTVTQIAVSAGASVGNGDLILTIG